MMAGHTLRDLPAVTMNGCTGVQDFTCSSMLFG
jgi:hypothetical protein